MAGQQAFLNAEQNYPDLIGMKANLYKCFLPQAWQYNSECGVSAVVHPEGVYDDPKGGALREKLYARLRKHFMFANERKLFPEVDHHTQFSLNVYGGPLMVSFDTISNLYDASSIVQCYEGDPSAPIPGIKDEQGNWNTTGHPSRVIHVTKKELGLFARLFDNGNNWKQARMPSVHVEPLVDVLKLIEGYPHSIRDDKLVDISTVMWDETKSLRENIIRTSEDYPTDNISSIYSGPNIGLANPVFKGCRKPCLLNSDYDVIDLTKLGEDGVQRLKYAPDGVLREYVAKSPSHGKYITDYRIVMREMVGTSAERCLLATIIPPECGHILTVFGMKITQDIYSVSGTFASLPSDYYIKTVGRNHMQLPILESLPHVVGALGSSIAVRSALLNSLNKRYSLLWNREFSKQWIHDSWSKTDPRLAPSRFTALTDTWNWDTPLRTDYERRQALVEIDVLTAMALGMTLQQLKTIYRIQFPVLQGYEADTWYDANGRIVFTTNRSLTGVGFDRPTWENQLKGAAPGQVFTRTITDDTQPGGPVERTIEYVAPFDRCNREKDYETAWAFFEKKSGGK